MYHDQEYFIAPDNENATIWRYMDLERFVSLISTNSLWFSSLAKLREQDKFEATYPPLQPHDPLKGAVTVKVTDAGNLQYEYFQSIADVPTEEYERLKSMSENQRISSRELADKFVGVSCWYLDEGESAAMWKIYGRLGADIAIRSTYSRLRGSFDGSSDYVVLIGKAIYDDHPETFVRQYIPDPSPLLFKKKAYQYENELRAVLWEEKRFLDANSEGSVWDLPSFKGRAIPVNLDTLIDAVYPSPFNSGWFRDVVEAICQKFGVPAEKITESVLTERDGSQKRSFRNDPGSAPRHDRESSPIDHSQPAL